MWVASTFQWNAVLFALLLLGSFSIGPALAQDQSESSAHDRFFVIFATLAIYDQQNRNATAAMDFLKRENAKLIREAAIDGATLLSQSYRMAWQSDVLQAFLNEYLQQRIRGEPEDSFAFRTSFLHLAIAQRDLTWVKLLIENGCDANIRDSMDQTPIIVFMLTSQPIGPLPPQHGCVVYDEREHEFDDNDSAILDLLLAHGLEINATNVEGETVLNLALRRRNLRMAKALLNRGADPYFRPDVAGAKLKTGSKSNSTEPPIATTIVQNTRPDFQSIDSRLPILYPYLTLCPTTAQLAICLLAWISSTTIIISLRRRRRNTIEVPNQEPDTVPASSDAPPPSAVESEKTDRTALWRNFTDWQTWGWLPWVSVVSLYSIDPLAFILTDWRLFLTIVGLAFLPLYLQHPQRPKLGLILSLLAATAALLPVWPLIQQGQRRTLVLDDSWAWVLYSTFAVLLLMWSYLNLRQTWFHWTTLKQSRARRKSMRPVPEEHWMPPGDWDEHKA